MITFEDVVRSTQDQMLTALTSWQQGAIDAFHGWMKAVGPLMPDLNIYRELPTFAQDALGDPERIVESSYTFAIQVLDLHKDFMLTLFRASLIAPQTPFVPQTPFGVPTKTLQATSTQEEAP